VGAIVLRPSCSTWILAGVSQPFGNRPQGASICSFPTEAGRRETSREDNTAWYKDGFRPGEIGAFPKGEAVRPAHAEGEARVCEQPARPGLKAQSYR
jgi:hypothetical protein